MPSEKRDFVAQQLVQLSKDKMHLQIERDKLVEALQRWQKYIGDGWDATEALAIRTHTHTLLAPYEDGDDDGE